MPHFPDEIEHSQKYEDTNYEYKSVYIPKSLYDTIPKGTLFNEQEIFNMGIQQTRGWEHYYIFKNEPHILHFRRPIGIDKQTGLLPSEIKEKLLRLKEAQEKEKQQYIEFIKSYTDEDLKYNSVLPPIKK